MKKYTLIKNKVTGERAVRINQNGVLITEKDNPAEYARIRKNVLASNARAAKDAVYESLGLTKVRGALGGTYYE